jgi:hypothetical protein
MDNCRLVKLKSMLKKLYLLLIFFVLLLASGHLKSAKAQNNVSLRIAPLSYDLAINPGEEKSGKLFLENGANGDLEIQAEFSDFFVDDAGKYIFSDGWQIENQELKPYLMKNWITVDRDNFELRKNESVVINYKISVPQDANLGGHYGVIFFRTLCNSEQDKAVVATDKSTLCVSGRVGTLFLVQVGGLADRAGKIEKVEVPKFSISDKADVSIEIRNVGNTHFKPEGEVLAKNLFGQAVYKMKIKDKTLLPTTSHIFSGILERKDMVGFYKIDGYVKDGNGNELKFRRRLFMPPWKEFLIAVLSVLAMTWFLRKFRIRKIKK